ncbi:MAG: SDR family oxidoreductase [Turneriella sp.]|nr:SDR family oxidoreductase [Turneriella sp.]
MPERSYALITGASAGLGRAFALELAANYNLILVARRAELLQELAHECAGKGALCETIAADLTVPDMLAQVEDSAARNDVTLLVNNAGFGTYGAFADLPRQQESEEILLNVLAVVRLTHAALSSMLARGHGSIINVASVAAFQPAPYSATYAASKCFVRFFTEAVAEEVRAQGVYLQVLCPGLTHTEFHERAQIAKDGIPEFLWMDAESVVRASLAAMARRETVCIPGGVNQVLASASGALPTSISTKLAGMILRSRLRP